MPDELFLVVAYDIASDRRRNRLVKFLKDYGERVNFSVFECRIKSQVFQDLKDGISNIINRRRDSVLFYILCAACERKRNFLGIRKISRPEMVIEI